MTTKRGHSPDPGVTLSKRLLGQVLMDGGFISRDELARALKEQNRTNEMLGTVLVRMGAVDPDEIGAAVSIQSDLASLEDAVKAAAGVRRFLGELLLKAKRITARQLDRALAEQRRTGEKLGQVLVRLELITERELHAVLAFQRCQGGEQPASVRLRLGEILVTTGQITREQLEDVLARQQLTKKRIGDLLVESGHVKPHQVARGLRLQEKLVTAALVAALSLAGVAAAPEPVAAGGHSAPSTARVEVSATLPARASMKVLSQSRTIAVTDADVGRGYVDVPAASRLEVLSNSPAGYLLVFERPEGPSSPFGDVMVRGLGREVRIGPGGGLVPQPYSRGSVTLELGYRFSLSKEARSGTYAWPLAISARPL